MGDKRDGGMDTVSGGDTFALYRVRGRCCGRAQNPGHRPPHTLISTDILARPLDPASPASRKKVRPKVAHPSSSVQPYSVTPPPSSYSSWSPGGGGGRERPEVCRVATRFPAGIPRAVAVLGGLSDFLCRPLPVHEANGQDKVDPSPASC